MHDEPPARADAMDVKRSIRPDYAAAAYLDECPVPGATAVRLDDALALCFGEHLYPTDDLVWSDDALAERTSDDAHKPFGSRCRLRDVRPGYAAERNGQERRTKKGSVPGRSNPSDIRGRAECRGSGRHERIGNGRQSQDGTAVVSHQPG